MSTKVSRGFHSSCGIFIRLFFRTRLFFCWPSTRLNQLDEILLGSDIAILCLESKTPNMKVFNKMEPKYLAIFQTTQKSVERDFKIRFAKGRHLCPPPQTHQYKMLEFLIICRLDKFHSRLRIPHICQFFCTDPKFYSQKPWKTLTIFCKIPVISQIFSCFAFNLENFTPGSKF